METQKQLSDLFGMNPLSAIYPVMMEAVGDINTPPISSGYGVLLFPMDVATCSCVSHEWLAALYRPLITYPRDHTLFSVR